MSSSYTKLFNSILDSTVWDLPDAERLVWITMLAMADARGVVEASLPGLARRARVPLEACAEALKCFQEPDPHSRTVESEGRRIEPVDGGWRLLNYEKYRQRLSAGAKADYMRDYMRNYRNRGKVKAGVEKVMNQGVKNPGTLAERLARKAAKEGDQEMAQRLEGMEGRENKAAAEFREDFYRVMDLVAKAEAAKAVEAVAAKAEAEAGLPGDAGVSEAAVASSQGPVRSGGEGVPEVAQAPEVPQGAEYPPRTPEAPPAPFEEQEPPFGPVPDIPEGVLGPPPAV